MDAAAVDGAQGGRQLAGPLDPGGPSRAGEQLRAAAVANLNNLVADANATGLGLLLSLRHEFPSEWSAFANGIGDFTATLSKDHFPYLAQNKTISIAGYELYRLAGTSAPKHRIVGDQGAWDTAASALNDQGNCPLNLPDPAGPAQVLTRSPDADVWLIVRYALG